MWCGFQNKVQFSFFFFSFLVDCFLITFWFHTSYITFMLSTLSALSTLYWIRWAHMVLFWRDGMQMHFPYILEKIQLDAHLSKVLISYMWLLSFWYHCLLMSKGQGKIICCLKHQNASSTGFDDYHSNYGQKLTQTSITLELLWCIADFANI